MEPAPKQHACIYDSLGAALAAKPLVAREAVFRFPAAADDGAEQAQSALRRFRSLSVSTKEHSAWTEETVKRKYPTDKTVELSGFSSDFETADLNQMLVPYQHNQCDRGGYRIKWLNDTRALAVFRRAETAQRVLHDLRASRLVETKLYVFHPDDLGVFNRKFGDDGSRPSAAPATPASADLSEPASPRPGLDEEHIRYKYRPEVTIELHDFPCPLETTDLQKLFEKHKCNDNIVRIKWFNRNRALAWFTNPQAAAAALDDLRTCELVHVKPYVFSPADMKYFSPEQRVPEAGSGGLARRRTIGSGGGLARRNTVSGASHYHRGYLYATAIASPAVPLVPSGLGPAVSGSGAPSQTGGDAGSPPFPPRRQRRFSRADA
ncbi:hypothetical protein LPJ61_001105 [Coemansia biformis]|uniref:Uncharacterized protein n=1 Tax=Coemansia biformis TaxID=1286918 RepID=A0A9W7YFT9_9FUNG|nr:hypothetical protein LPJ61_001105 [Coemansia biformis]